MLRDRGLAIRIPSTTPNEQLNRFEGQGPGFRSVAVRSRKERLTLDLPAAQSAESEFLRFETPMKRSYYSDLPGNSLAQSSEIRTVAHPTTCKHTIFLSSAAPTSLVAESPARWDADILRSMRRFSM